ncbi:hypothetical protein [Brevundimonas poindexterae]|uniref:hypothetical protein n=1 Tax=Brevundimonas poindexterae TaxID=74325 RepID=UPI001CFEB229|nr:hypothetical protein [Brevundimonas poindexterae]
MIVRTLLLGTTLALGLAGTAVAQDAVIRTGGTDAVFASQNTERMWEAVAYSNPLPPGAPTADYPLVAWCEAMVSGHVALGQSLETDDELDLELIQLGQAEARKFTRALEAAAPRQSPESLSAAEAAAASVRASWAQVMQQDLATRDQTFGLFFGLPGRCEHAARRIHDNITTPPATLAEVGLEPAVAAE